MGDAGRAVGGGARVGRGPGGSRKRLPLAPLGRGGADTSWVPSTASGSFLKAPTVQRKVASPARPVTIGMHFGWDEGRANLPSQAGLALEIQQPSGVVRPHTSTNPRDMFLFVFYSSHNYT